MTWFVRTCRRIAISLNHSETGCRTTTRRHTPSLMRPFAAWMHRHKADCSLARLAAKELCDLTERKDQLAQAATTLGKIDGNIGLSGTSAIRVVASAAAPGANATWVPLIRNCCRERQHSELLEAASGVSLPGERMMQWRVQRGVQQRRRRGRTRGPLSHREGRDADGIFTRHVMLSSP
ncbi:hypothetical protein MTO96_013286 [Rhipicephalus appendiculatus]